MLTRKTPKEKKHHKGITALKKITIGGADQWILMRGANRSNPILLFVHGGPGAAQIGFARPFQSDLEKHFIVVNWDQRGAGLSYSKHLTAASMTINQFVSDLLEIVQWLLKTFKHEKVYLVGHSWGSIIGMLAVQKRPEWFYAYFGVGQVADINKGDFISYKYTLRCAEESQNKKAICELQSIGEPPWHQVKHERIHQKWLKKFGGLYKQKQLMAKFSKHMLFNPEYHLTDLFKHIKGQKFSMSHMYKEMSTINLAEQVTEVQVPVFFCIGRHDYLTPFELAEAYFKVLKAPQKGYIWFEHSAHSPHFEEYEKFNDFLIKHAVYH
ncbi:pimeloyl-ACP methyl ester carboxylesterase [Scopulibacillus daqui]|uniref:Pimeloyl-ACP methyl ester carboxylesterase n=1 Tax=Scopulibacillus daqui TaxID=1469162 RepID=A0ABS2PW98_9BACL|nr:alpha/beta hydrolase [Scopulibacillus daqui]MBM7643830.1 pimeloyl-ACP methyl ester carboxylesterase [Scopulibacillus daqui]